MTPPDPAVSNSDSDPADSAGAALAVADLRKSYNGRPAVDGITFSVRRGECAGLLGPNGAGKTTTLRICLGATRQDSGDARILGLSMPENALAARRRTGVVPQKDSLDPDFNCAENLEMFARYFGVSRAAARARIPALLDFAGLAERRGEPIANLSGGMQRRLTLARALVNDPDLVFLDEPTTGLDPQARHLIWERLRRLRRSGKTLLLTTHFMEEAERLCDRVYVMDGGKIVADGPPAKLVSEKVEREVVEIYGEEANQFLDQNQNLADRRERFGELSYCYCRDAGALAAALGGAGHSFTHRPANLEDVFLKLVGRALRE